VGIQVRIEALEAGKKFIGENRYHPIFSDTPILSTSSRVSSTSINFKASSCWFMSRVSLLFNYAYVSAFGFSSKLA